MAAHLWQLDAAELSAGFGRGAFTPVDSLESCLERAAQCQPLVNAFVHIDEAGARVAAQASAARWARHAALGPLDGVPVSLKDNLHARGLATTWGSRLLRSWVAPADELPVARVRAAGAVIFGKTNLPEFALQGTTENLVAGITRNPWNTALTPGGSSGGGAAAVACGCGPLALVTDGGGSTRRPASHTGIVGLKPSAGLVARGGGLPEIFLAYEVPGMLARSVGDAALLLRTLAGTPALQQDQPAPPSRILFVPRFAGHPVDARIAECTARAAHELATLGHHVDESAPVQWAEQVNEQWPVLSTAGLAWMMTQAWRFPEFGLTEGQAPDIAQCSPAAQASLRQGQAAPGTALFAALAAVHQLEQAMDELFKQHDFILTPATASLPWPVEQSHPAQIDGHAVGPRGHAIFTAFANAAGLPAIALPGGFSGGLPCGFQLVGRRGGDAALLALALQHERAFPQAAAWPTLRAATMLAT